MHQKNISGLPGHLFPLTPPDSILDLPLWDIPGCAAHDPSRCGVPESPDLAVQTWNLRSMHGDESLDWTSPESASCVDIEGWIAHYGSPGLDPDPHMDDPACSGAESGSVGWNMSPVLRHASHTGHMSNSPIALWGPCAGSISAAAVPDRSDAIDPGDFRNIHGMFEELLSPQACVRYGSALVDLAFRTPGDDHRGSCGWRPPSDDAMPDRHGMNPSCVASSGYGPEVSEGGLGGVRLQPEAPQSPGGSQPTGVSRVSNLPSRLVVPNTPMPVFSRTWHPGVASPERPEDDALPTCQWTVASTLVTPRSIWRASQSGGTDVGASSPDSGPSAQYDEQLSRAPVNAHSSSQVDLQGGWSTACRVDNLSTEQLDPGRPTRAPSLKDQTASRRTGKVSQRTHEMYSRPRHSDGLYHCPFATAESPCHSPCRRKCEYEYGDLFLSVSGCIY